MQNPFPGPQPYRASDRERFFGREDMAYRLEGNVVTNRCVTVHGPSGAGKSSLMQASVIPALIASHGVRAVRVDGWPEGEDPSRWLASAMYTQLGLGELPGDLAPGEAIVQAAQRAARRSSRLLLVYLDQIEQILYASRRADEVDTFFENLQALVDLPLRNARVVLSLREDYLGRFRDRARDRGRLLENGFRVGPLTVAELCGAVCQAAATGEPPQRWSLEPMRELILQMRVPGEAATDAAEAQSAYAQIVCRALFQERAGDRDIESEGAIEAEPILRRYLDATLQHLGKLGPDAQRLLEDHLVTADGTRTLRTEKELLRVVPQDKLSLILEALEGAAILHAEAHQGSRYFEIGHDWLARKVYEQRQQREREEEQETELRKQRAEADARLAKAKAQRRLLGGIALGSIVLAAGAGGMGLWAIGEQKKAEAAGRVAEKLRQEADRKAIEASDARLLAGFRELKNAGQLAWGTKLLTEVQLPYAARGWVALASDTLRTSALERTLGGGKALTAAAWSDDGKRISTASADGSARRWDANGAEDPVVLAGDDQPTTFASWSPDGRHLLTVSNDGTARVRSVGGTHHPLKLEGHAGPLVAAAWSGDGARVVVVSRDDAIARIWSAGVGWIKLEGHKRPVRSAVFLPDGERVLTASDDKTARLWSARGGAALEVYEDHKAEVVFVAPSPDGTRLITTSRDRTARIWSLSNKGKPIVLEGHDGSVDHAAWSSDGARVATASHDKTARIWSADGKGDPVILHGHSLAVTFVAFRPDGRYVSTASLDQTARLWPVEGGTPLVLGGHDSPVQSAVWSPDGARVLTASSDARIWRTTSLESLPRERHGFFHSAFIGAGAKIVAAAYDDGTARLWPADGIGEQVRIEGRKEWSWITGAATSPDGARIVTTWLDGAARIFGAKGGDVIATLKGHGAAVRCAAYSPDGKHIVTVSDDRTARVFAAEGGDAIAVLHGHEDGLTSAAWSPDGQRIATTSLDRTVRLWRADGTSERVLHGHGDEVDAAAWSPDGKRLATASHDGTAQIWDAASGAPLSMREHNSPVISAIWSPDGKRLATSSRDGTVRLWSADGRGEAVVLQASAPVIAMTFVEDGKAIFAIAADDTPQRWTIDVAALKLRLASSNVDCLPVEMRATYFGEPIVEAREKHAACERAHGKPAVAVPAEPPPSTDASPAVLAPRGPKAPDLARPETPPVERRRVAVLVLPGDALVEVDGQPARRRDGVIELVGKVGDMHRLRAFKGTKSTGERPLTIPAAGAAPVLVDLNAAPAAGPRAKGAGPRQERFGFDE